MAGDAGDEVAEKINSQLERIAMQEAARLLESLGKHGLHGAGQLASLTAEELARAAREMAARIMGLDPGAGADEIALAAEEEARLNSGAAVLEGSGDIGPGDSTAELYAATSDELAAQRNALDAYGVPWVDCGQAPQSGFYQTTCVVPAGAPADFLDMVGENSPASRVGKMGLSGAISNARAELSAEAGTPTPEMRPDFAIGLVTDMSDPGADRIVDWLQEAGVLPIPYQPEIAQRPEPGQPGLATIRIYPERAELAKKILDAAGAEVPGFDPAARVSNYSQLSEKAAEAASAREARDAARGRGKEAVYTARGFIPDGELGMAEDGTTLTGEDLADALADAFEDSSINAKIYPGDGGTWVEMADTELPKLQASSGSICAQVGRMAPFKAGLRSTMARFQGQMERLARSLTSRVKSTEMRPVDFPRRDMRSEIDKARPARDKASSARAIGRDENRQPRKPSQKK